MAALAGRLKSSDTSRPPGTSTRVISAMARSRSGTFRKPYPTVTTSTLAEAIGRDTMSPVTRPGRRPGCARSLASSSIRWVTSSPTACRASGNAPNTRSPVPQARSSTRWCGATDAISITRRFHRASSPNDRNRVMKS
jgi:hypothetical protein